jgi:putative SOS response-associated peptidase YedK
MSNLYRLRVTRPEMTEYFAAQDEWHGDAEKDYIAPGTEGPIVREQDGQRLLTPATWGFPTRKLRGKPAKAGESPFVYDWRTNARHLESTTWKFYIASPRQRCLVPFTQFAAPKGTADRSSPGDRNWWFAVDNQEIPAFAGIWKIDQDHGPVYSFLTTEPNSLVAPKHAKAMPVILAREDHDRWLRGTHEEALALQQGYPSQLMSAV